jgi:hypothetical protein
LSGDIIADGFFSAADGVPANNIARYTPATNTWTPMGAGTSGHLTFITALSNDDLYAVGQFPPSTTLRFSRYNAAAGAWTACPSDMQTNGDVQLMRQIPGGDIIIAGAFSLAGFGTPQSALQVNNIGRYHPATHTWSAMGAGVSGASTQPRFFSSLVLANGDVIIGGQFHTAGGVTVNNIARYTPATNTWSALGTGIGGEYANVYALLALPNGDLLAGGEFDPAGGLDASSIARYSFTTGAWSSIGWPAEARYVYAMANLPDGDVLIGGGFPPGLDSIVRFHPATGTWRPLGTGLTGSDAPNVRSIIVLPRGRGDVIVGGSFSAAGGHPASNFARYTSGLSCCGSADFNNDGDSGTDADIEAFIACIAGNCCAACGSADFNNDGDVGTDADIEAFFRVLGGGRC